VVWHPHGGLVPQVTKHGDCFRGLPALGQRGSVNSGDRPRWLLNPEEGASQDNGGIGKTRSRVPSGGTSRPATQTDDSALMGKRGFFVGGASPRPHPIIG